MQLDNKNANKAMALRNGIVADVKLADMANGDGVRTTIFVSGCLFNCANCFNKLLQNFNYGKDNADSIKQGKHVDKEFPCYYDKELEDTIIDSLRPSYINGLTLLGGEPFMNTNITVPLAKRVREEFGNTKTIWSWTGYEWEELQEMLDSGLPLSYEQAKLLRLIDVLVDGRYVDSIRQQDLQNNPQGIRFRGSSNQRIINVPESIKQNKIIERTEFYEGEVIVPRDVDFKTIRR